MDVNNKKILSKFNNCPYACEFFGIKNDQLVYMDIPRCKKNTHLVFSESEKTFVTVNKACDADYSNMMRKRSHNMVIHKFKTRHLKDRYGQEFKGSYFPLTKENCR